MKPMSAIYYFINNIKKILPVGISICLGVMFFYFLFLAGRQATEFNYATHIKPNEYFSRISSSKGKPEDILQEINKNSTVEKIIPLKQFPHIQVSAALGNNSAGILFLRTEDISYLMEIMRLDLMDGDMPNNDNEIILHWRIAANKKLRIGDLFVDSNEIQNSFKVVGIFDGSSYVGFVPAKIEGSGLKDWAEKDLLLIPKEGELEQMNAFLSTLPTSESLTMDLLSQMKLDIQENSKIINSVMVLLMFIVIIVLCITLSNTSIMHFYQRKGEFGLLAVVGYSRWEIIRKLWLESIMTYASSFFFGIGFSIIWAQMSNILVWNPIGEGVPLWDMRGFLITASIPIFVIIFSTIPIIRLLHKKDMIQIIDGM